MISKPTITSVAERSRCRCLAENADVAAVAGRLLGLRASGRNRLDARSPHEDAVRR